MKLKDAYIKAQTLLKEKGIQDYICDARFLLCGYLKKDASFIVLNSNYEISDDFFDLIYRRINGEPCAYITGETEFMSLNFKVKKGVLIPRQDTEILVTALIDEIGDRKANVLDVCTGSGCIAVSLKKYCKNSVVSAVDISDTALSVARENAKLNNVEIKFIKDDILNPCFEYKKYDYIVSNPPYIESEVIEGLDCSVKDFEPRIALDGGRDGLVFYKKITSFASKHLTDKGMLAYETGYNQGISVPKILIDEGFTDIMVLKDYSGNDRVVKGEMQP